MMSYNYLDPTQVGDIERPTKQQLASEGWTVYDDDGKDMTHWSYGKKRPDTSEMNKQRRGIPQGHNLKKGRPQKGELNTNWKGGISLDKKEYDRRRYELSKERDKGNW